MKKTGLIYLASPYTDSDPAVMEKRFQVVNKVAAELMKQGYLIFSPISHTHPIAVAGGLPRGWEFWARYDRCILRACIGLMVLKQSGWEESKGVRAELKLAAEMKLSIEYCDYCIGEIVNHKQ